MNCICGEGGLAAATLNRLCVCGCRNGEHMASHPHPCSNCGCAEYRAAVPERRRTPDGQDYTPERETEVNDPIYAEDLDE